MTPADFLIAARVPPSLKPQTFGLWTIERRQVKDRIQAVLVGWQDYTLLWRVSTRSLHLESPEVVMEDSLRELQRHLPIWMQARGRVLVTGLGLGCVVRGLLASPQVEHVDVVEIDADILRVVGTEFAGDRRVALHRGDALTLEFPPDYAWDYAWHDLWLDDDGIQRLHGQLMVRFRKHVRRQGAWAFPREFARLYQRYLGPLLGSPQYRERAR